MTTQDEFFDTSLGSPPPGGGIDANGGYILFFALQPDESTWFDFSRTTRQLFDRFGLRGTTQDRDRLHLTVGLPGAHVRKREPFSAALMRSLEGFYSPAIDVALDTATL